MSKSESVHVINVQLRPADKRLLKKLVSQERLPQTEVIRRLIRQAAASNETHFKAANA